MTVNYRKKLYKSKKNNWKSYNIKLYSLIANTRAVKTVVENYAREMDEQNIHDSLF